MHQSKIIIWSISGSDCSGGAGIAADIKTAHVLGAELCTLMTANTSQNSRQLIAVNPTAINVLAEQVELLIDDKPPNAIKIGLVANRVQLTWLINFLANLRAKFPKLTVIYDPVAIASAGGKLSSLTPKDIIELLPHVDVITPNLHEIKALTAHFCTKQNQLSIEGCAHRLIENGCGAVIVKGGHSDNDSFDYCDDYGWQKIEPCTNNIDDFQYHEYALRSPKIATDYSHGSGCSYASCLATLLAQGYLLRDAMTLTKAFINQGLSANINRHDHYGAFEQRPLANLNISDAQYFPTVITELNKKSIGKQAIGYQAAPSSQHNSGFSTLDLMPTQKLGLYPIVDSVQWLERLLPLGLEIIQLRLKHGSVNEIEQQIAKAVELAKHFDTRLFINDHWQLAIKYQAYGIHLGQEDLATADLAAIQRSGIRLGISTHGCYEFILAQQLKPSYLAIGAIFPTTTKDMTGQIQGIDNLKQILQLKTSIPVVAIGGINLANISDVNDTGVDSIAVVTAITEAEQPEQTVRQLKQLLLPISM